MKSYHHVTVVMSKIKVDREALYNYLISNLDRESFDRKIELEGNAFGYYTLEEFYRGQRHFVDHSRREQLRTIEKIRSLIERTPQEGFNDSPMIGVVIDVDGKSIVLRATKDST